MTLSRRVLKRVNSPLKSPKLTNSSLRKKTLIKKISSNVQIGASSKANLKVVVRVRPESQREIDNNARSVVDIVDDHMLIFDPNSDKEDFFFQGTKQKFRDLNKRNHKEQKFIFEKIFDPSSTNEEIFETTTKDIVDTILNGYNCSVFAYGATGSGKTHTMLGNESCPGITFLTVMELYQKIEEVKDTKVCEIGVSYLEVYNEMVRDLISPSRPLNLHETGQHVQITGLSLHKPQNAEELLKILAEGNHNRSQHPTDSNSESSRSHAVFQVFVRQHDRCSDLKSNVAIAKLSMIDLAGSERGAATSFKGARFREGANINKSLLALGNCINALADGKGHVPYRDSKLTRLLKDSLGGNCRSVMVATITQSSLSFENTFNTLRYANRAKTIKMTLKKNVMNVDQHVSQYLKVVDDLKGEISILKEQLKEFEEIKNEQASRPQQQQNTDGGEVEDKSDENTAAQSEFMVRLHELNCECKKYQREMLQLETTCRELELKIYTQRILLVRMNLLAFASKKLDKGISKSERLMLSFENRLSMIKERKVFIGNKLEQTKLLSAELCDQFNAESEGEELPGNATSQINQNKLEQNVRDSHQVNEYLRSMVKALLGQQKGNEKILLLLLISVKQLYIKLKMADKCDSETDDILEKIFDMLDASRIEWADLKNTDSSFGIESISEHVPSIPSLDKERLTEIPLVNQFDLTPVANITPKVYRRSSIKKRPSHVALPNQHQVQNLTSLKEYDDDLSSPVLSSQNDTFNFSPLSPPVCASLPKKDVESVAPTNILPNEHPLTQNNQPLSEIVHTSLISGPETELKVEGIGSCDDTPAKEIPDICIGLEGEVKKGVELSGFDCNFSLDTSGVNDTFTSGVNSTFTSGVNGTFTSEVNGTFSILEDEPIPPSNTNILQPLSLAKRNKHNFILPKPNFKKPGALIMTPSKYSFSKLPQQSSKSLTKGFKRSISTSSIHSSSNKNLSGKGVVHNSLKKSFSFLKPRNQENVAPKMAFGSSLSLPRNDRSRRLFSSSSSSSHLPAPLFSPDQ